MSLEEELLVSESDHRKKMPKNRLQDFNLQEDVPYIFAISSEGKIILFRKVKVRKQWRMNQLNGYGDLGIQSEDTVWVENIDGIDYFMLVGERFETHFVDPDFIRDIDIHQGDTISFEASDDVPPPNVLHYKISST